MKWTRIWWRLNPSIHVTRILEESHLILFYSAQGDPSHHWHPTKYINLLPRCKNQYPQTGSKIPIYFINLFTRGYFYVPFTTPTTIIILRLSLKDINKLGLLWPIPQHRAELNFQVRTKETIWEIIDQKDIANNMVKGRLDFYG